MEKKAIFCIRCDGLYLERFSASIQAIEKDHSVHVLNDYQGLQKITENNPTVILVTIRSQSELVDFVRAMQQQTKAIQGRYLTAIVVQTGLNEKHEKALLGVGVKEVLPDRQDLRGINSKIDRYLKVVQNNYAKTLEVDKGKTFVGSSEKSSEQAALELVHLADPIVLPFDYWIINPKRPAQRNMGRWIVTVIGPSPSIGVWNTDPKDPKRHVFDIYPSNLHSFYTGEGKWVYHGGRPEFSFELGRWSFVGPSPRLEWVSKSGDIVAARWHFDADTKKLNVANNSEITQSWLKKIEATFDRDYRFRDEKVVDLIAQQEVQQNPELDKKFQDLVKDIPPEVVRFLKNAKGKFGPKSEMFAKVDEKQLNKFLEMAGDYQDRGILWLTGRVFLTDVVVHQVDIENRFAYVMVVPPRADPMSLIDEGLSASGDQKVYVNLKLLETSLFFYSTRDQITCEEGVLCFPIPGFAYEVQRRVGMRLVNTPRIKGLELKKIPPTAKGAWKIIDISAGGIGLEMEQNSFEFAHDRPFKIDLLLQDSVIGLICKVRWMRPSQTAGKIRVGARFEHLSQAAGESLELYIMEKHLERIRQGLA